MKILKIAVPVVLILIISLVIAAPWIAEYIAFRQYTPATRAAMKAQYKDWKTKPVTLPAAALDAKPYSPELLAAMRAYREAWKTHSKLAMDLTATLGSRNSGKAEPTVSALELAELAPLTAAFTALARRPDYTIAAAINYSTGDFDRSAIYLSVQSGAKVLRLQALAEARAGRLDVALHDAETIVFAARSDGYDPIIPQLIDVAICDIGVKAWNGVLSQCNDPALLRRTLAAQQEVAGQLHFFADRTQHLPLVDLAGMLREYKRGGIDVDYQNLTAWQMFTKCSVIQAKINAPATIKRPEAAKSAMPKQNEAQAKELQAGIDGLKKTATDIATPNTDKEGLLDSYRSALSNPFLFTQVMPNTLETATRSDIALTRFDLLRLETARKLYQLEKGKAPATDAELVPGYLAALPVDRFEKGKEADIKEAGGVRYSIGPDGKDNGNAINYDPSNGTYSAGDIALGTR